tara:strand:- start:1279 stop:1500 length:222 start_codon:yes stop_codon:yes gene_type:complete
MPTFEVCCLATVEIYATFEAPNQEAADSLASDITIVNYSNNTIGADTDEGEVNQVVGHDIYEVQSVTETECST